MNEGGGSVGVAVAAPFVGNGVLVGVAVGVLVAALLVGVLVAVGVDVAAPGVVGGPPLVGARVVVGVFAGTPVVGVAVVPGVGAPPGIAAFWTYGRKAHGWAAQSATAARARLSAARTVMIVIVTRRGMLRCIHIPYTWAVETQRYQRAALGEFGFFTW